MFGTTTTTATPTSTASSVATDKAVVNAPQTLTDLLKKAGYKVVDVHQPMGNIPIKWTTFAPPLPFRIVITRDKDIPEDKG